MEFQNAISIITQFWPTSALPFIGGNSTEAERIAQLWKMSIPTELHSYLIRYAPNPGYSFASVGNPLNLYATSKIQKRVAGYNYNPVSHQDIDGWSDSWVLIGDEGADPLIVDLSEPINNGHCVVLKAYHGAGEWSFSPIADSIPRFLLLQSALHHALIGFDIEDSIIDDSNGFNLAPEPAAWLFPIMKKYAGDYYQDWVGVFDNA